MSTSNHCYKPLSTASQIRLVNINPSKWDDKIVCSFETTPLDDYRPYEVLLYMWSDAKVTRLIVLNSWPFDVTVNLESALTHLRRGKLRLMWIDAICIN